MKRFKILILTTSILTTVVTFRSVLAGIYYMEHTFGNDEYSELSWEEAKATIESNFEIVNPSEQNFINIVQSNYYEIIRFFWKILSL